MENNYWIACHPEYEYSSSPYKTIEEIFEWMEYTREEFEQSGFTLRQVRILEESKVEEMWKLIGELRDAAPTHNNYVYREDVERILKRLLPTKTVEEGK